MSEPNDKRKSKTNVRVGGSSMPTNPYYHALNCLGGKWKMTLIHEMANFGSIRFNRTRKALKMSEKVLSAQLVELIDAGVVRRNVDIKTNPPTVTYALTESGKRLIPIIDAIYIWSMRDMCEHHIPIDMDALFVHSDDKYIEPLENVLDYEAYQKVVNLKEAQDSTGDKGQSLDPRILTYWPLKPKPAYTYARVGKLHPQLERKDCICPGGAVLLALNKSSCATLRRSQK